jgi:diketogulonate reductase-like aldo/keto reductase
MRRRPFGKREIGIVGQGTWRLDDDARAGAIEALRRGLDAGMTHIDTAEMYGEAEPLVADAIAGRRDEVFLVSKVLPSNASQAGTIAACERSLKRLRTDRLDSYLLHWRGSVPLEETFAAFQRLERDGKILSFGVSNFDEEDLAEAVAAAGEGRIACNQVLYYLGERAIEHAVIPFCRDHGIAVVAYSPYGSGDFPASGSPSGQVLREVAAEVGATPRQIALAFLLRDAPLLAIPKAASAAHAAENAEAGALELDAAQIARIDSAFPRGHKPRHLPMI